MPGCRQRSGFGLAVADDAGDDEIGIVEGRAEGMDQRIAELAAFVDRARRLGRDMARHAAGEGELLEQLPHAVRVHADLRIDLAVAAFEIGVRHHRRPAMAGTADVETCQVARL